ncbi:O-antigen ligase family protein [Hymenobacter cellulosivorans]|uniref:O-antigen ligase family protein n=1 Tax=Hymenobacter cellulosivorans TaxID=2932249 RepID=A0ABY4FA00_9BACT|nr:O-antigen ligase family protein [Hymenobacter cellulosivorans]UOQ53355.1 O-antigen ligase family protein [Hymenobacter cellulosivorans]
MQLVLTIPRLTIAAAVFCSFIIVGLFVADFFRILPSIGIVGITLTAICYTVLHRGREERLYNDWRIYAALACVFLVHVAAGVNTSAHNLGEYTKDVVLQSPFLLLPLAFWLLPALPSRYLARLWQLFIGCVTGAALVATGNYLLHAAEINEMYLHSKIMPTEPDHIRFSLMVTLATAAAVVLLAFDSTLSGLKRGGLVTAVVLLALFQHLLAVRSGLVTFYAVGVMMAGWLLRQRAYRRAALVLTVLVALPLVSYVSFPTFRNKFVNTQDDLNEVNNTAAANNYSLVARVYSYKVAAKLVKDNPWFGVSKADMPEEMAKHYAADYPSIRPQSYIQPHNQFIYSAVAFGLIGVLVFTLCFYYPLLWTWPRFAPLVIIQYVIVSLSFLVEYTLETQIGLTYSLFFILLGLNGLRLNPAEAPPSWRPA